MQPFVSANVCLKTNASLAWFRLWLTLEVGANKRCQCGTRKYQECAKMFPTASEDTFLKLSEASKLRYL